MSKSQKELIFPKSTEYFIKLSNLYVSSFELKFSGVAPEFCSLISCIFQYDRCVETFWPDCQGGVVLLILRPGTGTSGPE